MNENEGRIMELTQEVARLRGWLVEAIGKACYHCEEYPGHNDKRCEGCGITRIKKGIGIVEYDHQA